MNKLVRDHYPVENLPEDLREGFAPDGDVRVTVEPITPEQQLDRFAGFRNHGRQNFSSMAEIDAYVSALRSEGDDPDR